MKIPRLLRNLMITVFVAGLAIWLTHRMTSVHLPFLVLVLGSGVLGFCEPKHGWAWVLVLIVLVLGGHFVLKLPATDENTADFATYIAPFPALVGGLIGRLSRNML